METVSRLKANTHLCGSAVYRQSLLSSEPQQSNGDSILSIADFTQTVDRVKAPLLAMYSLSVADQSQA
jgi:hypothetical protein